MGDPEHGWTKNRVIVLASWDMFANTAERLMTAPATEVIEDPTGVVVPSLCRLDAEEGSPTSGRRSRRMASVETRTSDGDQQTLPCGS